MDTELSGHLGHRTLSTLDATDRVKLEFPA